MSRNPVHQMNEENILESWFLHTQKWTEQKLNVFTFCVKSSCNVLSVKLIFLFTPQNFVCCCIFFIVGWEFKMHGTEKVSLNFLSIILYMRFEFHADGYQYCAPLFCDAMLYGR